jgi:transcriptional regulator with XRE-family HTH domain
MTNSGDDPRKQFGDHLRSARVAKGLSQEELADRSGLNRTYVGSVERGERNVSLLNIHKLAAALGVAPSTLLDDH